MDATFEPATVDLQNIPYHVSAGRQQ
eukprot:SAG31_NODE_24667_length_476_cov_1.549072_2_plen_25_part_01